MGKKASKVMILGKNYVYLREVERTYCCSNARHSYIERDSETRTCKEADKIKAIITPIFSS